MKAKIVILTVLLAVMFLWVFQSASAQDNETTENTKNPRDVFGYKISTDTLMLVLALIAIFAVYHIYYKGKRDKLEKTVSELKGQMDMLGKLFPQLKSLERLEDSERLNLGEEDIKKTISDILKNTNITPEAIDTKIEEKVKERFSDFDKRIAEIVAEKLNEIDKRFKKPIGSAIDYLILGNAEYYEGNYLKAIENYDKAIEINSQDAKAYNNRGLAYSELKEYKKAIEDFDKAIEINPQFEAAYNNRGVAYAGLKDYKKAFEDFDKAIEIYPQFADAHYNLARVYTLRKEEGDKETMLEYLKKAIELGGEYKKAKEDEDFKDYWDDPEFKELVE